MRLLQKETDDTARDAAAGREISQRLESLRRQRQALEALDPEVRADFRQTEAKIHAKNLAPEIIERHRQAVAAYEENYRGLMRELLDMEQLDTERRAALAQGDEALAKAKHDGLKQRLGNARALLGAKVDERRQRLDPHKLPRRPAESKDRQPRLKKDDFREFQRPPRLVHAGALSLPLLVQATADLPTAEDLAESVDVQFTPGILDLANRLDRNAIKIFDHVRRNVHFVPSYGSIQGAEGCRLSNECNAFDTASLLIALLRASGIPARYVTGTIQVPIARVMNWVGGFDNPAAALTFISSAGTPVVGLTNAEGQLIAARLEHIWVEAYVDYVPSRGIAQPPGDMWVALDASFKQLTYTPGVDFGTVAPFDAAAFFDRVRTSATVNEAESTVTGVNRALVETELLAVQQRIVEHVRTSTLTPTVGDVLGGKAIVSPAITVLPGALPYDVIVTGARTSTLPNQVRFELSFDVFTSGFLTPDLSYRAALPELVGKRVTLSYAPATPADEAALVALLPNGSGGSVPPESIPTVVSAAYLIKVKPELRIDGRLIAAGQSVTLGQQGNLRMTFNQPKLGANQIDNPITAGTYNAIVINTGRVQRPEGRAAALRVKLRQLEAGNFAGIEKDDVAGELLHTAGLLYWTQQEVYERAAAKVFHVATTRLPSEGIFTYDLAVSTLFGVPITVRAGALITDVDSDVRAVVAKDGDRHKAVRFMLASGVMGSRAENGIYDQLINGAPTGQGISAISYLEAASQRAVPIYTVDARNIAQVLPRLAVSAAVKADIANAVNAGKVVTIPQTEFEKDGFLGIGYTVIDLNTGAGAYLISSAIAGGGFQLPSLHPALVAFLGIVLVGIGLYASLVGAVGLAILVAVLTIALVVYDAISTYQEIARSNPQLSEEGLSAIATILAMVAMISIVLALIGIFAGSLAAFIAFSIYWIIVSFMVSLIVQLLARVFSLLGDAAGGLRGRERLLVA